MYTVPLVCITCNMYPQRCKSNVQCTHPNLIFLRYPFYILFNSQQAHMFEIKHSKPITQRFPHSQHQLLITKKTNKKDAVLFKQNEINSEIEGVILFKLLLLVIHDSPMHKPDQNEQPCDKKNLTQKPLRSNFLLDPTYKTNLLVSGDWQNRWLCNARSTATNESPKNYGGWYI